jgi:hypothetical protein
MKKHLTNKGAYEHCEDGYACDHGDGEGHAPHHSSRDMKANFETQMDLQSCPMPHQVSDPFPAPAPQSDGMEGENPDDRD